MKKISFITCIVLMLFTACENETFFEFERPVQSPWNTLPELDRAAIGGYWGLFQKDPYIVSTLYKNAEADDVSWISAGDSWGYFRDTENQKQFLPDVFVTSYKVICSVNDALEFIEENGGNPYPTISDDDKKYNLNRVIGELHFLRGFAYYINATVFCNAYVPGGANDAKQIPLIIKTAVNYTDAVNPKIGTVGEVWAQIQSDFEKAFEFLPERYIAGKMNVSYQAGRATKFAAAAMLARTHFALGNYDQAKDYTDFVIDKNGGDYDLSEDPIKAFNKITLSRGKESILWIPFYDQATSSSPYLFGDGEIIKADNSPAVYLIENGKKRAFSSGEIFEKLGYQWKSIIIVPEKVINLYNDGEAIIEKI
ncbi:MAG: hypothetical protein EOM76_08075 [Sphingobacteriia bacterium]|nr:hypothetical protein [Sphingobacteriia bacterium]